MTDLLFDEDDGDFDDLYSSSRPAVPAVKQNSRINTTSSALPRTPKNYSYARSPGSSSSVISRSGARDRTSSWASSATEVASTGPHDRRRRRHGKPRRRGSQELFDVQWQSNDHVFRCGLCGTDFSLIKRRHHCRPCGRVMCSECSSFLYFELSHRKHRVCVPCNKKLLAEQAVYDRNTLVDPQDLHLFEASGLDGQSSVVALTPVSMPRKAENNGRLTVMHGNDKEKNQPEKQKGKKSEKMMETAQVATTMTGREKVQKNEEEMSNVLFDSADDDWFSDVSKPHVRVGGDEGSDTRRSSGEKQTYTVTNVSEQTPVPARMTGSTLTAKITGKGDISEQFRYDEIGGPGFEHDLESLIDMPRPKQVFAMTTGVDHSKKLSKISVNDNTSEHFHYTMDGPGLGHDDDRILAMPRPMQLVTNSDFSYDELQLRRRQAAADDGISKELYSYSQLTTQVNQRDKFDEMKSRMRNTMTLDELNMSSLSEHFGARKSAMPRPHPVPAQFAIYGNDADKPVIDDSPIFESTTAKQVARKEDEQQRQLVSDINWVSSSALPSNVPARRFSSRQESYSMVENSWHSPNSSVTSRQNKPKATANGKSGFTSALKRFFGMKSKSKPARKRASTLPKSVKAPSAASASNEDGAEAPVPNSQIAEHTSAKSDSNELISEQPPLNGLERHTIDDPGATRSIFSTVEEFRHTLTRSVESRDASLHSEAKTRGYQHEDKNIERSRRDTFDALFESPKKNMAFSNNHPRSADVTGEWAASRSKKESVPTLAVGVSGFDQQRPREESDAIFVGDELIPLQTSNQAVRNQTEAWRHSAAMSLLDDRKIQTESKQPTYTWSNVQSDPTFGSATYAVPTSLHTRLTNEDNRGSTLRHNTIVDNTPLVTIMDDLNRKPLEKSISKNNSVDDFFAEFEEPNEYLFDSTTGKYVATQAPLRSVITQRPNQSESPESQPPSVLRYKNVSINVERYDDTPVLGLGSGVPPIVSIDEKVANEVAEVIADKISVLEDELAALKQLIRNQKGSGRSEKPRVSRNMVSPVARKENIFDDNGSNSDNYKLNNAHDFSKRSKSRKKTMKKRKDSFADLFEDSPNDNGAMSYEALFQTEIQIDEPDKEVHSDEDTNDMANLRKKRSKSRRHYSREIKASVSAQDDTEDLTSRSGKQSSQLNTGDDASFAKLTHYNQGESRDVMPVWESGIKQFREDDPIDALFDISNDRDVPKLYEDSDHLIEQANTFTTKVTSAPITNGTSNLSSQLTLVSPTDDKVSHMSSTTAASVDAAAPVRRQDDALSYSIDTINYNEADDDENFAINWAKIRKIKSRRHKSGMNKSDSSIPIEESDTFEVAMQNVSKENLSSDLPKIGTTIKSESNKLFSPVAVAADAASVWMPVTQENTAANLIHNAEVDTKSSLQPLNDSQQLESSASPTVENGRQDAISVFTPVKMEAALFSAMDEVVLIEKSNDFIKNTSAEASSPDWPEKLIAKDTTDFGIFKKNYDFGFVAAGSLLDDETPADERECDDEDSGSVIHETESFNFEIKSPHKLRRPSASKTSSKLTDVSRTPFLPLPNESSPSSPATSVDENVELEKYLTSSEPSIDNSPDDSEGVSEDEAVIGDVALQAFHTDWQQMQVKEKERKKRLRIKQRQAQRDKALRKQGVSSKPLSSSAAANGATKSKDKKKKKDKDDATSSGMQHKKSGLSRRHRQRDKDIAELPRSLTEL
ncbi:putative FYVE zinc finger, Zinc finger, FYVE/PHD-type, Zinc finger, RING/FYVE/PHD-type [Plasmopara halstedii]